MKIVLKTLLFTVGVLFFTGGACPSNETTASNKVAQSEIFQSYAIEQNGQVYDVTAYFRVGGRTGTTLALSAPSRITFNGQGMQEHLNTMSGTYYTTSVPVTTANGTFAFTDRNGKSYSNRIELARTALETANLRVDGVSPTYLKLTTVPPSTSSFNLQFNNRLVFVAAEGGETTEAFYDRPKNSIVVMPLAWKEIAAGNVAVDLEVRNAVSTLEGTALGGEMSFVYDVAPLQVALVKGKTNKAVSNKTSATAKK